LLELRVRRFAQPEGQLDVIVEQGDQQIGADSDRR
jgi:hypothetical protein